MTDFTTVRSWLSLFFLIVFSAACMPTRPVSMTEVETIVGSEIITEKEVPAVVYEFSNRIHSAYLDTTSGLFTLQFRDFRSNGKKLRNSGRIMVFDPDSSTIYWDYRLPYNRYSYLQHGSKLIEYSTNGGHFINLETGRRENSLRYQIYHIDPVHNMGMGYRLSSTSRRQNTLYGFDIHEGNEMWQRPIRRDYDWNDLIVLNDTTTILVAGGIHTIDPRDGSGWSYDSQTGKKDYTAAVVGSLVGIAAGLLTGHYSITTGHTLISDMVSNVLIDDHSFTLATANEVVKLDYSGEVMWSQSLNESEASYSTIWEENDIIYMLNTGYARRGYFKVPFGTAFITAFEKETGNEIYKNYINIDKKEFIHGQQLSGDRILLLFDNRIEQYALSDGTLIKSKITDSYEQGSLVGFVGYQVFRQDGENVYYSITTHDSYSNYILTMDENVLVLDHHFEFIEAFPYDELFLLNAGGEDYYVITNYANTHSLLLDRHLMPMAEIEASGEVYRHGNSLYIVDEKKLVKLDLFDAW